MLGERITAGDLEHIFRENYSRYYYYALSVVDDSEVAKDVIGEVFLAVWRNRDNIDRGKLNSYFSLEFLYHLATIEPGYHVENKEVPILETFV